MMTERRRGRGRLAKEAGDLRGAILETATSEFSTRMQAQTLREYAPTEVLPGPDLASDEQLSHAAGDISTTIFHPVSTARMGHDPMAVVSHRLTVHGLAGISIADASVMPAIPSGNTHAPVTMIAEKAADMILARAAS